MRARSTFILWILTILMLVTGHTLVTQAREPVQIEQEIRAVSRERDQQLTRVERAKAVAEQTRTTLETHEAQITSGLSEIPEGEQFDQQRQAQQQFLDDMLQPMRDRATKADEDVAREQAELERIDSRLAALRAELEGATAGGAPRVWTSKTPNPNPRSGVAVAAVGGKIYVIGGQLNRQASNRVDEYDPATDTWTAMSPIPTPRIAAHGAVVDGKIYVLGGGGVTAIEAYDPETDAWVSRSDMPERRIKSVVTVANGRIYMIGGEPFIESGGGFAGERSYQQNIAAYDPEDESWRAVGPAIIVPVSGALSVTVDGQIYILGGNPMFRDDRNWTIIKHDPATDKESRLQNLDDPPIRASACAHGDRIYLFGKVMAGEQVSGTRLLYRGVTQVFDPAEDRWEAKTPMPSETAIATCANAGGKIYVGLGGKSLLEYDPAADQ